MQTQTSVEEGEFMALAPDVGVIPPKFRNRGYDKLDFGPGEGGLGDMRKANERGGDSRIEAFLAGVAAGANPQELASNLLTKTTGRGRGQKGAVA